jgi:organic radical activating enzyme
MGIHEIFESYQGTGLWTGTKQLFVRTSGCSVACPIRKQCDERAALTQNANVDITNACETISRYRGKWLHITGGEPLHDMLQLSQLISAAKHCSIQVQTSGLIDYRPYGDVWVTCSPKCVADECKLARCDELVFVAHATMSSEIIADYCKLFPHARIYVVPLWGDSPQRACELVDAAGGRAVLGIQAHKYWGLK